MWIKCSEKLGIKNKTTQIMLEDGCIVNATMKCIGTIDNPEALTIWEDEFGVIRYPIYWREID